MPKQVVGKGRGRPARKKEKTNNLFVELIEKVQNPEDNNVYYQADSDYDNSLKELLSTKVANSSSEYKNDASSFSDSYIKSGVLCEEDGKFFVRKLKFIKAESDAEIPVYLVEEYKLKENDRIEYLVDNEKNELLQLFKINDEYVVKPNLQAEQTPDDENKEVVIEQTKIKIGKTNIVYAPTVQDRERMVDSVCDYFNERSYNTVKVCFDRNLSTKSDNLGVIKAEIFSSCIGDEFETMSMIDSGIDKAVFFSALNNKAVLVLDNLAWLLKVISTYPESIYGNFIEKMVKTCKNSNITLVCVSGHLKNDEVKELANYFDKIN